MYKSANCFVIGSGNALLSVPCKAMTRIHTESYFDKSPSNRFSILNQNAITDFQKNAFENVVRRMAATLSRRQWAMKEFFEASTLSYTGVIS